MISRVNIADVAFTHPDDAPEVYRGGVHHFAVGAQLTHAVAFELAPGQGVCPYHYEYGHELWAVVLEGRPTLRTADGIEQLGSGDVVFCPRGPEGAHQLVNRSESRVRLLGFSNAGLGATAYPDSDKVGVWTTFAGEDFVAERSSEVSYYHNETAIQRV